MQFVNVYYLTLSSTVCVLTRFLSPPSILINKPIDPVYNQGRIEKRIESFNKGARERGRTAKLKCVNGNMTVTVCVCVHASLSLQSLPEGDNLLITVSSHSEGPTSKHDYFNRLSAPL